MRKLTFEGFLKQYLQALNGARTLSLSKLVRAALENARLAEPLYLYAVFTERTGYLMRLSEDTALYERFFEMNKLFSSKEALLRALNRDDARLPERYRKVYISYQAARDRNKTDREYSLKARKVILRNLEEARVSKYRVYTDLNLNPGNINNYLKNADATKISRETVNKILDYSRALVA